MDSATDLVLAEPASTVTSSTSWASLPCEIRRMILNLVRSSTVGRRWTDSSSPKAAPFATVCREWQVFFEACTFRRLVLDPDSLGEFGEIIRRHDTRLGYVRKLWLRVRLPKYECPECDEPEDSATQRRNDKLFTTCLQSLLGTLQLWDPARHGAEGLALMLSASSPSDSEHRFFRCEISDIYPFHYFEDLDLVPGIVDFHRANMESPFNFQFHRGHTPPWESGHVKRIQGTSLHLEPRRNGQGHFLSQYSSHPAVPMVKGLVIRRQFRRQVHVRTLAWLLDRCFVALECFRFERTVPLKLHEQISFDQGFQLHLLPSLPKTLRRFTFTQWETPEAELGPSLEEIGTGISSHALAYLPLEMAKLSQRLEQFCPPWQMDTAAFLRCIIELEESSGMLESSLKRLNLRCPLSSPDSSSYDFASLVILAAKAALSLPRLQVMEIWGTCLHEPESHAYIFQYECEDRLPNLVWRSSEETLVAQAPIIAKWDEVAQKHGHSSPVFNIVPLAESKIEISHSVGTCIYRHLLLKDLVFDPITQIILENEVYGWTLCGKEDSLQHDSPPFLGFPNSYSLDGNLAMGSPASDIDSDTLQEELMAFDAGVQDFLQGF